MVFTAFFGVWELEGVPAVQGAERIVSLKPNITEILFDLGVDGDLVGGTTYCLLPPDRRDLPRVADYIHADVEKVIALQPTLVLGSKENSLKKEILFLEEKGIRVALFSFTRLEEIMDSIQRLGQLLSRTEKAKVLVEDIKLELERLRVEVRPFAQKPRVLMIVGMRPLVVVGKNNFLDDLMNLFGLGNIAAGSKLSYPTYSTEQLIASAPDIIFDLTMGTERVPAERQKEWYGQFPSLPAVRKNQVFILNIGDFPASRGFFKGVREMAAHLKAIHH